MAEQKTVVEDKHIEFTQHTEQLQMWLDQWSELPKQGTAEWDAIRQECIGNSELDQLEHREYEIVLLKCGLKSRPDMTPMRWGSFVEIIARTFAEDYFNCHIYEASSLPSIECKYKRCSPDGLAVVQLPKDNSMITFNDSKTFYTLQKLLQNNKNTLEFMKILFEFKSLFSRTPKYGDIPRHYVSQVMGGLADIGILEKCIYIECVVKFATLEQIIPCLEEKASIDDVLSYTSIHYDPYFKPKNVLGLGILVMYDEKSKEVDQFMIDEELIKVANMDWFKLFGLVKSHKIQQRCFYVDMNKKNKAALLLAEMEKIKLMPGVIGVMYYKLFDVNIVIRDKKAGYSASYAPLINRCIANIKQINASTNKAAEYTKIYNRPLTPNFDNAFN